MKILLVAVNSKFIHTNIAVRYIRSFCSDFDIKIKEYTINDSTSNILRDICEENVDIIGFSCYIWNIEIVLKICTDLKKLVNNSIIILGGPEVSFDPCDIMQNNKSIDFIVRGEGEISSRQLFSYLNGDCIEIESVKGIVYRKDDKVVINENDKLIKDLDILKFPYSDNLDVLKNKILYYESSRGCPFSCSYCLSSTIEGVRFLSLDRVKKDLMWFIDRDVELVKFVDRTFNCGKNYFEILKFLAKNCKNTRFHFEITGDILDDDVIEFLNSVPKGLFQFEIGVQTTNQETLASIDRNANFDRIYSNIYNLRKKDNINLHLDLIAGLPGESYTSFSKSFNDTIKLRPHMLQLGFLKLLKGSKMRKYAEKYGIIYTDSPVYEVLKTDSITFAELSQLKDIENMVDRYYNSGRFSASIKFLLNLVKNPFEMFNSMVEYRKTNSKIGEKTNSVEQYQFLYEFCIFFKICNIDYLKEFLLFDYLEQGRNPVTPDFLKFGRQINKQYSWDLFSKEENIKKYLPQYNGIELKDIIKKIYLKKFSLDIIEYIRNDRIINRDTIIIFDYGSKNIKSLINYICIYP